MLSEHSILHADLLCLLAAESDSLRAGLVWAPGDHTRFLRSALIPAHLVARLALHQHLRLTMPAVVHRCPIWWHSLWLQSGSPSSWESSECCSCTAGIDGQRDFAEKVSSLCLHMTCFAYHVLAPTSKALFAQVLSLSLVLGDTRLGHRC